MINQTFRIDVVDLKFNTLKRNHHRQTSPLYVGGSKSLENLIRYFPSDDVSDIQVMVVDSRLVDVNIDNTQGGEEGNGSV